MWTKAPDVGRCSPHGPQMLCQDECCLLLGGPAVHSTAHASRPLRCRGTVLALLRSVDSWLCCCRHREW